MRTKRLLVFNDAELTASRPLEKNLCHPTIGPTQKRRTIHRRHIGMWSPNWFCAFTNARRESQQTNWIWFKVLDWPRTDCRHHRLSVPRILLVNLASGSVPGSHRAYCSGGPLWANADSQPSRYHWRTWKMESPSYIVRLRHGLSGYRRTPGSWRVFGTSQRGASGFAHQQSNLDKVRRHAHSKQTQQFTKQHNSEDSHLDQWSTATKHSGVQECTRRRHIFQLKWTDRENARTLF